jgi:hypothetical protein
VADFVLGVGLTMYLMDAYELVEIIRKKPSFYLPSGKSLKELSAFIGGYEIGAKQGISSDFRPFNKWLARKYGLPEPSGWRNMITSMAASDEKAFDHFFELIQEF